MPIYSGLIVNDFTQWFLTDFLELKQWIREKDIMNIYGVLLMCLKHLQSIYKFLLKSDCNEIVPKAILKI